jgi:DHA1 family multidrug resistance protein-like MFS transporter
MKLHMESTIFGQLVRHVSGNRIFRYPDEIDCCFLWTSATQRDCSQPAQPISPENNEAPNDLEKEEQNVAASQHQTEGRENGSDLLVVDWYGPDDPEVNSRRLVCV